MLLNNLFTGWLTVLPKIFSWSTIREALGSELTELCYRAMEKLVEKIEDLLKEEEWPFYLLELTG